MHRPARVSPARPAALLPAQRAGPGARPRLPAAPPPCRGLPPTDRPSTPCQRKLGRAALRGGLVSPAQEPGGSACPRRRPGVSGGAICSRRRHQPRPRPCAAPRAGSAAARPSMIVVGREGARATVSLAAPDVLRRREPAGWRADPAASGMPSRRPPAARGSHPPAIAAAALPRWRDTARSCPLFCPRDYRPGAALPPPRGCRDPLLAHR